MNQTIFLNKNIEVLIVSAGGVGTTFLMEAIAKYKNTNCSSNTDGYKHLPIPPISMNRELKVVYVFGDPILASISLFRRNYHFVQSKWASKFQSFSYVIPKNMTLEEYGKENLDGHYFEMHLNNWKEKYACYPTFFLKYETLYDSLEALQSFLEIPNSFVEMFPAKKERQSDLNLLSQETLNGLKEKYGKYQLEVEKTPSYFVQSKRKSIYSNCTTKPYRAALTAAFFKKTPMIRKLKNKFFNKRALT